MQLKQVFDNMSCQILGASDTEIRGLAYDSRSVRPGDLFFCIEGFAADGNRFAAGAVAAGAAAIMSERAHPGLDVPQVIVKDARRAMALASACFYGCPAKQLQMIGVTGTNGKTTTTYMVKQLAEAAGRKVGLIGTIRNMIGDREIHAVHTTPEAPDLHRLFRQMLEEGCDTVVMEVSSHALALDRTFGIPFEVGVFTNLTQDHLDFHRTFDAYLEAKGRLFGQARISVINMDDPYAERIAGLAPGDVSYYSAKSRAQNTAEDIIFLPELTRYSLARPGRRAVEVAVPIPGQFTVYNSLAALAAASACGIPIEECASSLMSMRHVSGRFELLDTRGHPFSVILDYAHTPDSLENTLRTIREFAQGRVVTVFGCGGNRDRGKRPIMGDIAARYSDVAYVTSDNPRFEDPEAILDDILEGIDGTSGIVRVADRRRAIYAALHDAIPGDTILLAGKGHETYQEIQGVRHDFDEKIVVQELLDELGL